jgi:hypothetical protein
MQSVFFTITMMLASSAIALQCGNDQQNKSEIRNLIHNRGPVAFNGQIRYGAATYNKGKFGQPWTPQLFCGAQDALMFEYSHTHHAVEFFECRGGQIYYNLNEASGVICH